MRGDNLWSGFEANESISAGSIVAHAATGVSWEVGVCDGTAGEYPVGVALFGAKDGDKVTIAGDGCIVYVNFSGATDAGDYVEATTGGAVIPVTIPADIAQGSVGTVVNAYAIGQACEDVAAAATGRIIIRPTPTQVINLSA